MTLSIRSVFPLAVALVGVLAPCTVPAGPVNINTADAATIARELKGIGLKRAQAIIDYRTKHGAFKSADELGLVRGIGQKVIQKNRAEIRVEAGKAAAPAVPASRSGSVVR